MDDAELDALIGWLRELHDYSMDEAADAITALRAERDVLAKERELRMAVWKADTQAEADR